jgi:hypothetical protein
MPASSATPAKNQTSKIVGSNWTMTDQDELSRLVAQALEAAMQGLPPDRREQALRQMRAELGHFLCHAPMEEDFVADIASRARIAALFGTTYEPPRKPLI